MKVQLAPKTSSQSTSYICVYFTYGICHSHIFMYAFSNDHNAIPHYIIIPVAACTRQHPGPWVELQSAEARAAIAPLQRFMYATRDSSYFDSCVIMQSHTTSSSPLLHAHGNTLVPGWNSKVLRQGLQLRHCNASCMHLETRATLTDAK